MNEIPDGSPCLVGQSSNQTSHGFHSYPVKKNREGSYGSSLHGWDLGFGPFRDLLKHLRVENLDLWLAGLKSHLSSQRDEPTIGNTAPQSCSSFEFFCAGSLGPWANLDGFPASGGCHTWGDLQSSSIFVGFSIINHPAMGVPPSMQTPI